MLEDALQGDLDYDFSTIDSYVVGVNRQFAVFKLHGSTDWGSLTRVRRRNPHQIIREVETQAYEDAGIIDREDDLQRLNRDWSYIPAIAIPTKSKFAFACPKSHCDALERGSTSLLGQNLKSIVSVVSFGPGSKVLLCAARSASTASTGCPPTTRVRFTLPSGAITISTRTVPVRFSLRANSGTDGVTRCFTGRLSCEDCARNRLGAPTLAATRTATAIARLGVAICWTFMVFCAASSTSYSRTVPCKTGWPERIRTARCASR